MSSTSSSDREDIFTTDPFVDFWEDPEVDNCRASRNWAQHQVVEYAGQFKFAEHTPEPADAFPAARWSSFTVVELDVADCTIELAGGTLASAGSAPTTVITSTPALRSWVLSQSVSFGADT
ncbi:hypothetical protein ACH439_23805 [Streptomyces microflavus]|uniref:hypothetical protein n=1 Tax=Streptomyces microflavus TaxID=1919 RepID=UPI0037A9BC1E